ncbi:MAG: hypothetical protein ACE5DK_04800 [Paracoccaceae bacterium]
MSVRGLDVERIQELFTTRDGSYHFARWGRPIAPVVFGTDDETLGHLKNAMSEVIGLAGLGPVESDPDFGVNLMVFFCREWDELDEVPVLARILPDFGALKQTLGRGRANRYRTFNFDEDGAIQMCIILLRLDDELAGTPVQTLGIAEMLQSVLVWGDAAFVAESPIATFANSNRCIVKPDYTALIRAAYDPVLDGSAVDKSHALRLAARLEAMRKELRK